MIWENRIPASPVWQKLLSALALGFILNGCAAPPAAPQVNAPQPTAVVEQATAAESEPADQEAAAFTAALKEALSTANWDDAKELMADGFIVAFWRGNTLPPLTVDEAIAQLQVLYLPAGQASFPEPDAPLPTMVAGLDPLAMWPPDANVVGLIYSTNWGQEGVGEAFLAIGQNEEGDFVWVGLLLAQTGFDRTM